MLEFVNFKYNTTITLRLILFVLIFCSPSRLLAQDSLTIQYEPNILSELNNSNEALRTGDIKGIYDHIYFPREKKVSFEEFKESETTLKAMKNDSIKIEKFKLIKLNKVVRCQKELQCLIEQETFMSIPGKDFSFKSKLIAFSKNGTNWLFMNIGEKSPEDAIKLAPNVCPSVFED